MHTLLRLTRRYSHQGSRDGKGSAGAGREGGGVVVGWEGGGEGTGSTGEREGGGERGKGDSWEGQVERAKMAADAEAAKEEREEKLLGCLVGLRF